MNSTKLNLNANNATFQLYQLKDSLNLNFYSIVDWDIVVKDTPLEENDIKHRVLSSSKRINHVADAFRLAVIYKIGGTMSLFKNKRFMLVEMLMQNTLKFALFLEYENPHNFFRFSF